MYGKCTAIFFSVISIIIFYENDCSKVLKTVNRKLCDLIEFMKNNVERFPKLKAFLWTLDSRNIKAQKYGVSKEEELEEQTKLINSFLKLAYWY